MKTQTAVLLNVITIATTSIYMNYKINKVYKFIDQLVNESDIHKKYIEKLERDQIKMKIKVDDLWTTQTNDLISKSNPSLNEPKTPSKNWFW